MHRVLIHTRISYRSKDVTFLRKKILFVQGRNLHATYNQKWWWRMEGTCEARRAAVRGPQGREPGWDSWGGTARS